MAQVAAERVRHDWWNPARAKPTERTRNLFLAAAWYILSICIEFGLGFFLPTPGESLAWPLGAVALSAVVLIVLAQLVVRRRRKYEDTFLPRAGVVVTGIAVLVAALGWTWKLALPARVIIDSSALAALVQRADTSPQDGSGCVKFPHSFPSVPLLGQPDSVCISGGIVAFLRGSTDHTYGLVYVPPAVASGDNNGPQPLNVGLAEQYGCVQSLADGWWEVAWGGWSQAGVKGDGSCPFGVGDNAM